jgi:hypothetical protein
MRSAVSIIAALLVTITYANPVFAQRRGELTGRASQPSSSRSTNRASADYPVAKTKTVDVSDGLEWDYAIWSDSTGRHQVRAKPLSLDNGSVRLEKKHGYRPSAESL